MLALPTTLPGKLVIAVFCVLAAGIFSSPAGGQEIDLPLLDLSSLEPTSSRSSLSPEEEIPDPEPSEVDLGTELPDAGRTWIAPGRWFLSPIWERSIELGINGSEGNAQSLSLLASGRVKRETDRSTLRAEIVYGKSEANSVLTQQYGFLESRLDLKMGDSRWSHFNLLRWEYDEFKAFDHRMSLSSGLGYDFIKDDMKHLAGRFGAGASREFGGGDETWIPEAVFGADYEHELSKRQRLSVNVDYYPAWEDFANYRMVSKASWELLLDVETNLSLKVGLINRYDSTPFGRRPSDVDYFVTLLWKN